MTNRSRLRTKLCRELARSERCAIVHCRREATRFRMTPFQTSAPADALAAIAEHAAGQRPRLAHLLARRGPQLGSVGGVFAAFVGILRGLLARVSDNEQSYRATLLELRHGLDIVRLLRDVADREGDPSLVRFCDEMLVERHHLIERAAEALAWFAERPDQALASSLRSPFVSPRSLPGATAEAAFDREAAQ